MEPVAGGILAPLLLASTAYSNHLTTTYGSSANYWALGIFLSSWIAQFIGHGVFEGRAPALLDNLVQALFLAPFFVWMEILFSLGYRPELKSRVDSAVEKEVAKYRKSKQQSNGTVNSGKSNGKAPWSSFTPSWGRPAIYILGWYTPSKTFRSVMYLFYLLNEGDCRLWDFSRESFGRIVALMLDSALDNGKDASRLCL